MPRHESPMSGSYLDHHLPSDSDKFHPGPNQQDYGSHQKTQQQVWRDEADENLVPLAVSGSSAGPASQAITAGSRTRKRRLTAHSQHPLHRRPCHTHSPHSPHSPLSFLALLPPLSPFSPFAYSPPPLLYSPHCFHIPLDIRHESGHLSGATPTPLASHHVTARNMPQNLGTPSSLNATTYLPGSSSSNPIDGDHHSAASCNHPARSQPSGWHRSASASSSRLSDYDTHDELWPAVWQPDQEAVQCPVCNTCFSFFFRKHHCRRCGRVVCANCSPHRITLPWQYIVQPPQPSQSSNSPVTHSAYSNVEQWGGEQVRVCNPCIPCPSIGLPEFARPPVPSNTSGLPVSAFARLPWPQADQTSSLPLLSPIRPDNSLIPLPMSNDWRARRSRQPSISTANLPPHSVFHRFQSQPQSQLQAHPYSSVNQQPTPNMSHRPAYNEASTAAQARRQPGASVITASSAPASATPLSLPAPTVAEEDECPVCGSQLPALGNDGSTLDRENHVEFCIQSHMYSAPTPGTNVNGPRGSSGSDTIPRPSARPALGQTSASGSRPRRMTGGRMLVYTATEKDCVAQDGSVYECIICFEDFEVRNKMARLECLCKFHHVGQFCPLLRV